MPSRASSSSCPAPRRAQRGVADAAPLAGNPASSSSCPAPKRAQRVVADAAPLAGNPEETPADRCILIPRRKRLRVKSRSLDLGPGLKDKAMRPPEPKIARTTSAPDPPMHNMSAASSKHVRAGRRVRADNPKLDPKSDVDHALFWPPGNPYEEYVRPDPLGEKLYQIVRGLIQPLVTHARKVAKEIHKHGVTPCEEPLDNGYENIYAYSEVPAPLTTM